MVDRGFTFNIGGSWNGISASFGSSTTQTNSAYMHQFPYGCQWGCNRENVCSVPGNSCGRFQCNENRANRGFWNRVTDKVGLTKAHARKKY
jgi:hypothetical protein